VQVGINMGDLAGGQPAMLDIEELLATRLLVQGNSGSGKSHLLRRLLEQSAQWVQQVIIDPEGDFVTLSDKYGHLVVDGERSEGELAGIASRIRKHRVSCVLSLEGLEIDDQMRAAATFLNAMFDAEHEHWYPVLVVVDEAQMFARRRAARWPRMHAMSLGAMTNLMCRGRKRGLAGVIATQRLAKLAKNVAAEASNFLMGRTFLDIDMARAADLLGMDRRQAEMFRDLQRGNPLSALGPALSRRPLPIAIGEVETKARSSSPKLMPMPEAVDDVEDLIFTPDADELTRPLTRRARPAPRPTTDILAELSQAVPLTEAPLSSQSGAEAVVEDRGEPLEQRARKLTDVLETILSDRESGYRTDAALYQDFLVRSRMARISGSPMSLPEFRRRSRSPVPASTRRPRQARPGRRH
jgi:DNA helicase HerA-like ATPase